MGFLYFVEILSPVRTTQNMNDLQKHDIDLPDLGSQGYRMEQKCFLLLEHLF